MRACAIVRSVDATGSICWVPASRTRVCVASGRACDGLPACVFYLPLLQQCVHSANHINTSRQQDTHERRVRRDAPISRSMCITAHIGG